jgi:hypothetical protein
LWMHENGCDGTPTACPRPLIVTASGGASRAAFFMSSIVGYLMQESSRAGLDQNQMRNRLFAISGISGGSVGAVMVAAALSAKRDSTDHPCAESPVDLWWGKSVGNWRDCFESLTSGDFLTANFFGLTFNDMFPFGPWRDRAAVLEDAWTKRFSEIVTRGDKPVPPRKCAGLECPFWSLRPILGHWIPILVLDGTSEATGGRIITTLLEETYRPDASISCPTTVEATDCPIFVEAAFFTVSWHPRRQQNEAGLDSSSGSLRASTTVGMSGSARRPTTRRAFRLFRRPAPCEIRRKTSSIGFSTADISKITARWAVRSWRWQFTQ